MLYIVGSKISSGLIISIAHGVRNHSVSRQSNWEPLSGAHLAFLEGRGCVVDKGQKGASSGAKRPGPTFWQIFLKNWPFSTLETPKTSSWNANLRLQSGQCRQNAPKRARFGQGRTLNVILISIHLFNTFSLKSPSL